MKLRLQVPHGGLGGYNPFKYTDPSGYEFRTDVNDWYVPNPTGTPPPPPAMPTAADFYCNLNNTIFTPISLSRLARLGTGTYRFDANGSLTQTASAEQTVANVRSAIAGNGGNAYNWVQGPSLQVSNPDYNEGFSTAYTGTRTTATQTVVTAHKVYVMPNGQESGVGSDDRIFNFNGIVNTVNTGVGLLQHELKTQAKAGGNLAEIAQASKQLSKITAPFKILGSALGAYSAYGHWNKFSEAYNTGDTNAAIINGGKLLLDGVFLISKSTNPLFLGASVAYGVTDYLTSDY